MPHKSTGPYLGPPAWLDASKECSLEQSPTYITRASFVNAAMSGLLLNGLSVQQAAAVTANSCTEAAWGRACYWNNAGGWKITSTYASNYKAVNGGIGPKWWKARGNVDSGDPDWCFYRVFPDLNTFLKEWCATFVPKKGTVGDKNRYRITGEHFWEGSPLWFGDMIVAGYKGGPSALRMKGLRLIGADDAQHPSVASERSITQEVIEIWAQLKLKIDPDGAWGPKSTAACRAFQIAKGLTPSGTLTDLTLIALSKI